MDNGADSYRLFMQGDERGLEQIVELYNKSLLFFLDEIVHDPDIAEDLAADSFLELLIKKPRFRNQSSFKTYLFKIGRNNALDYLRRQSKIRFYPIETMETQADDNATLEEDVLKEEQNQRLHAALQKLNSDYREILHLLYFEDMTYDEAGFILKKNSKQVNNLAYRAKKALKAIFDREGFVYEND